ncbi:PAS domain S-box protein [Chitinophaga sp.]|uniref:PAS domain S-box protein n=1 Tax=Chitinophaga sp. TaxID=1869181 RepID=UPI0031D2CF90
MQATSITQNEAERSKTLAGYHILDSTAEEEFDRLTTLAALTCSTAAACITFPDQDRQWLKSAIGLNFQEVPREWSFTEEILRTNDAVEINDSGEGNFFRFFSGYPIRDPNGFILGALCVMDEHPRQLLDAQRHALQLIASEIMTLIQNRRQKEEVFYLEKLFLLSDNLISITTPEGQFKKANLTYTHIFGYSPEEMLQLNMREMIHPDDLPASLIESDNLREGKSTIAFENRLRTKSGEWRTISWMATAEPDTRNIFSIGRDITEERRKEILLSESESNFRTFFENSPGLMCTHNLQGFFLSVNEAGASGLGYTLEELDGYSLFDISPRELHGEVQEYLDQIKAEGKLNGIMKVLKKDGTPIILHFNNVLVDNYVISNSTDITVHFQLEKALKRSTEMLERTNKVARIGAWEIDMRNGHIFWSDVTREILEVTPDEPAQFSNGMRFYKEGENRQRMQAALAATIANGNPFNLELEIVTEKGNDRWVRSRGSAQFENGQCKRLYGTLQDITEKKLAEIELKTQKLRLSTFVEHAPAAVAMFDREMRYIAVSRRWLEEFRIQGRNVLGASHYEIFPNVSAEWKEIHAKAMAGEVLTEDQDVWRPEGWNHDQYLRWEVRPWFQYDGKIGGIMMFTQDITDAYLQQEEYKKARIQAEQANIAKSEFLANMSHEIRTPLNGVIGFTDLVLKTHLTESQHQYLSIVNQSANALLSIINDILDFSKIEAGKLELDIDKVDLYEFCSQASDIISYQAQNKGLELLLNVSSNLPRFVYIDEVRLKQILVNLMGNAVKFTPAGEIELKVTQLDKDDRLRFEVRDTGIGIRPEKAHKIFEAFLQEDVSTTKKYGGTGLGLTISNKLLALMGSYLQLDSEPGKGSRFFFDITVKTEDGERVKWEDIDMVRHVLIVDDNDNNRVILREMLFLKGISFVEARNGFEALEVLSKKNNFDVILMDYHMPFMDGIETIEKIRKNIDADPRQKIILLHSSSDDERIIKACERLHVQQRLVKPIKMQEMYNALSRLFKKEEIKPAATENNTRNGMGDGFNVLVVEDNPINMLLATTIIHRIAPAAVIHEAGNGKEALAIVSHIMPDIILMDIQMPEMNGYEASRQIRDIYPGFRVPIIALTAGNVMGEREKCTAAGMDDFMAKPFIENTMVAMFNKWLRLEKPQEPEVLDDRAEVFDIAYLKTYLGDDDPAFMKEILLLTIKEFNKLMADFDGVLRGENVLTLNSWGHKLRGVAVTVGLMDLAQLAETIEGVKNIQPEALASLALEAREKISKAIRLVENYVDTALSGQV